MFETLHYLQTCFCRRMTRKKSKYQITQHITLNNLIPIDKRDYLKGNISLVHCRGLHYDSILF